MDDGSPLAKTVVNGTAVSISSWIFSRRVSVSGFVDDGTYNGPEGSLPLEEDLLSGECSALGLPNDDEVNNSPYSGLHAFADGC